MQQKTKYKVVDTSEEYEACKRLLLREGFPDQDFMFPTIIAYQGRKLIGFLATSEDPGMILAGPLVLCTKKHRPWTAMKLMSLYETALQHLDINSYVFWIDRENSVFLRRGIEQHFPELKPYATEGDKDFYVRKLDDGRQDISTGTERRRKGIAAESEGPSGLSAGHS